MDLTSSELTIAGHQCFVLPKNLCETCIQDSGMSSVARATELSVTKKSGKLMTVLSWSFLSLKLALLFDTKISKLYCGNLGAEGLGGRRVNWSLLWICDLAFACKILECFVLSALSVFKLVLLCFLAIHETLLGYDRLRVCPRIVRMNTAMQPTFILEFLHHVLRADMVKKLAHQPARVLGVTFMLQILSG